VGFSDKLNKIAEKNNSLLCVGLDSDKEKIPLSLSIFDFNQAIIDYTFNQVCAYKINTAFYESEGIEGMRQLKKTIDYLKEKYPEIPVILDAKRGDIGNTNKEYAKFAFNYLCVDAITVNPYLGKEALQPFLEKKDKGIFILCRTSNVGAGEFQDLKINNKPLYQIIAEKVVNEWNYNHNCGLVVGATSPIELKIVRHIAEEIPLLIPGIGVQGGDIEATVKAGIDKNGRNVLINSSRGIIFASFRRDFAQRAKTEAEKLKNLINFYRKKR